MTTATEGFHHIALVTADAGLALQFYRDLLGLEVLARTAPDEGMSSAMVYVGLSGGEPGTLLCIIEARDATSGRTGAGGVHHFALTVDSTEAQLKWKRRLVDAGVPVSGPYNRGWFHSIYFADPDGQIVEIATRGPGYALDEAADALGSTVVIPPGAELRGTRDEAIVRARMHAEAVPEITPDMRLDGLHHISGITDDVARIGGFYEAALGLRLVKRSVNQDDTSMPHWFWANYDGRKVAPRSSLTMFGGWPATAGRPAPVMKRALAGTGQAHHIAFRAHDEKQLHDWQQRLRSLRVDTSDIHDHTWYRSFSFRAPDGQLMEIATDGPGFSPGEAG